MSSAWESDRIGGWLRVFVPFTNNSPILLFHQQAPKLRKEASLLFFGHLNQHLQAFHTDPSS